MTCLAPALAANLGCGQKEALQDSNPSQILHAEDPGAASDIKHNLVFEQVFVLVDRVSVRPCPHLVFLLTWSAACPASAQSEVPYQHFFMNPVVVIATRRQRQSRALVL